MTNIAYLSKSYFWIFKTKELLLFSRKILTAIVNLIDYSKSVNCTSLKDDTEGFEYDNHLTLDFYNNHTLVFRR